MSRDKIKHLNLFDWMIAPDSVLVCPGASSEQFATDKYVIIRTAYAIATPPIPEPGAWEVRKAKDARPDTGGQFSGSDPEAYRPKLEEMIPEALDDSYAEVLWSSFARHAVDDKTADSMQVGSLRGEPMGANAEWLRRVHAGGFKLYGTGPGKRMVITADPLSISPKEIKYRRIAGVYAGFRLDVLQADDALKAIAAGAK